jgi:hypothetical protein
MIREILASDVEYAQGMLEAHHSDPEVLASLTSRGVEPAKAAELLDDLRHGRKPNAQLGFVPRARRSPVTTQPRPARMDAPSSSESPHRHHHRTAHKRGGLPWWFVLLLVTFLLALAYAFVEMETRLSNESLDNARHEIPPPPGK